MFSVPTKAQYGIRALVHLARKELEAAGAESARPREEALVVTSAEIARVEGISPKYLEGILAQLKAAGLVLAARGKKGGYRLSRAPEAITMLAVVEALEGEVRPVGCMEDEGSCAQGGACLPRRFWLGLKSAIDGYLSARTLRDVIDA